MLRLSLRKRRVVFFVYIYGEHRDLHSFPTRRSSDLVEADQDQPAFRPERRPSLGGGRRGTAVQREIRTQDRKSTRLNSSHPSISYAVFCLKKKIVILRSRRLVIWLHISIGYRSSAGT